MLRRGEAEGSKKVTDNWMRGQGRQVEREDRREHGAVTLDGGNTEALGRPQPTEKISHLGKGRARHRVTM